MTYQSCITMVDTMQPNKVPTTIKKRWLSELEGRLQVEMEGASPEELYPPEEAEELFIQDPDTLTAPFPFDNIYWMYLLAMLDFLAGDSARYENSAALFNSAYQNYAKWVARQQNAGRQSR